MRDTADYLKLREAANFSIHFMPSLKKLSSSLLNLQIQNAEHCSIQDARAALRIYLKYRNEWEEEKMLEEISEYCLDDDNDDTNCEVITITQQKEYIKWSCEESESFYPKSCQIPQPEELPEQFYPWQNYYNVEFNQQANMEWEEEQIKMEIYIEEYSDSYASSLQNREWQQNELLEQYSATYCNPHKSNYSANDYQQNLEWKQGESIEYCTPYYYGYSANELYYINQVSKYCFYITKTNFFLFRI